ncbi:protein-disulfide reductase DsbD family protein [Xanthovirga aplysinae]|uniref:protein-disulfide reductase DsbD family protein n=1 Tax=Xanthovirga aplysinae TaxID=2529853 RepID=UPI0012BB7277|nr:cytochrome c biogenesis protein CcdA [Xanthovirga aplysinae]MTI30147.1 DUF255 domain-containing protein [Xanthovirga aplysinae]
MKRYFSFFILVVAAFVGAPLSTYAQILQPASWSYDVSQKELKVGDEVDLIFNVKIDPDWYLYSSDFDPDLGPMVTTFAFKPNDTYELVGDIQPIGAKKKYDDLWGGEYTYFVGMAEFRQKIKILTSNPEIEGGYEYQVCTDVDGRCIPFDDEFVFNNFDVTGGESSAAPAVKEEKKDKKKDNQLKEIKKVEPSEFSTTDKKRGETETVSSSIGSTSPLKGRDSNDPYSLLGFLGLAFAAGLAALLTPCVFPMIPMTVTFFTNSSKSRSGAITKAIIYGFSIIAIYTVAGTLVSRLNGPEFANWLSTHWLPNVFFFVVFMIFAMSFLGLFEITLPSSLVNKMDAQADKGGLVGVFFMAFTLVLVSFSCTGPIVGSILVESAGGQLVKPIVGMFGFSLAFAIPFTLFAIFPNWLSGLPKSGGWLNSVKVVLGFLELALGLKFLSVADQVYHWGILDREVYLALWIVIFTLIGFYLLGKIRLAHDSPLEKIGVPRLMLAIISFSFVVYMIPGMWGAPLKGLAGYLPPMTTHDFDLKGTILANGGSGGNYAAQELCEEPKYADMLHLPHGIKGYFDYDQALKCAREQNKPIFIDFTGHGCVNCREMEASVWSDPEVLKRLKEEFVVVALYVDEKTELPESNWYTSTFDNKVKKTIGKQNADFQITRYNNNAQPYYVLLGTDEQVLVTPKAYDLNVKNFVDFLDLGLKNFHSGTVAAK